MGFWILGAGCWMCGICGSRYAGLGMCIVTVLHGTVLEDYTLASPTLLCAAQAAERRCRHLEKVSTSEESHRAGARGRGAECGRCMHAICGSRYAALAVRRKWVCRQGGRAEVRAALHWMGRPWIGLDWTGLGGAGRDAVDWRL